MNNTDWLESKEVINGSITTYISLTLDRTAGHGLCSFYFFLTHRTDQTVGRCEGHFGVSEADASVDVVAPREI